MNILFTATVGWNPSQGGVEKVTDILTKELKKRGHCVYYLCAQNDSDNSGAAVHVFCLSRKTGDKYTDKSIAEYHDILNTQKIDVVINQIPFSEGGRFFLKHTLTGIRKISVYHSKPLGDYLAKLIIWKGQGIKGKLYTWYYRYKIYLAKRVFKEIIGRSDYLCLLSNSFVEELRQHLKGVSGEKLLAINNPNTFKLAANPDNASKDKLIVFVGRLNYFPKNTIDFIKMWEIVEKRNSSWRAQLIGDDSKCRKEHDYIVRHKIERCEFTGHQVNIAEYYRRASIICVTSHYEGWPMVLNEAMSFGCVPVVYATYSSVYEFITDGVNGFLINPYNIAQMAERVQYLIDHPGEMRKFSENAIKNLERFKVENIVDQWERLLDHL